MATYVNGESFTLYPTPSGTWGTTILTANTTSTGPYSPVYISSAATTMTATGTTTANIVWDKWRHIGHTQTTTIVTWQDDVWNAWEQDDERLVRYRRQADEMQAAREQRSREQLAAAQRHQEDRLVAHARALDLLDVLLTEQERASRVASQETNQRIEIHGSDGQLYWLELHRNTVHGNVVRVDEHGCILGRACVAPEMRSEHGALPTPDGWIGQYLGLKLDAANFLSHANWSQVRPCRVPALAREAA